MCEGPPPEKMGFRLQAATCKAAKYLPETTLPGHIEPTAKTRNQRVSVPLMANHLRLEYYNIINHLPLEYKFRLTTRIPIYGGTIHR